MPIRILSTTYGRPALRALAAAVESAKADDALAQVTVVIPSNTAGVAARRYLATDCAGVAAVTFVTIHRLAELLGAASLAAAHRRPVSSATLLAAHRFALRRVPGAFVEVAEHPATEEAFTRVHRELADVAPDALTRLERASRRAADVVAIYRAAREVLQPDWYDEADLLVAACTAVRRRQPAVAEFGSIIVHLPQEPTRLACRLLRELAVNGDVTVIVGLTGDADADRDVLAGVAKLGGPLPSMPAARHDGADTRPVDAVSASDADDEVRAAIRVVVDAARTGTALHRMAIVYASDVPYARLVTEHLRAAAISWNGPSPRRLRDRVTGRTLLALLGLHDRRLHRRDIHALLAGAPIRRPGGSHAPTAAWERTSRAAGVVSGVAEWDTRLTVHANRARNSGSGQADVAEALRQFVLDLASRTDPAQLGHTWKDLASNAQRLLRTYLGGEPWRAGWPEDERDAADAIDEMLERLSGLDSVDPGPDLARFRRAVEAELDADLGREGHFGEGVLVGPFGAALGLELDVVVILGMAEGTFPGRLLDDPLLPDRLRSEAHGLLPVVQRHRRLHRHLLAAVAAGRRVVVFHPRGDLRRSTVQPPSRALDTIVGASTGVTVIGSFTDAISSLDFPATEQERRLHDLLAGHAPRSDPAFERGARLVSARASATLTEYDGNVGALDATIRHLGGQPVAPTPLEQWASCPFAYFVTHVLGVRQIENPDTLTSLPPFEEGNLIHEVLEQFVAEAIETPTLVIDWTIPAHRSRLDVLFDAAAARMHARGVTGRALYWRHDRSRLQAELHRFLADDTTRLQAAGAHPLACEHRFGVPGSPIPAATMTLTDGRSILFRGSIDRVDRTPNGGLQVTDYKTGKSTRYTAIKQDVPHHNGTRLQLPIYALAAAQAFGDGGDTIRTRYLFVSDRAASVREIGLDIDDDVLDAAASAIGVIVDGIEAGLFPPRPTQSTRPRFVECPACDPDGLGTGDLRRQWVRKRSDPRLAAYLTLCDDGPDDS